MSVDTFLCHFGKEGSHPFDFHQPLLGILLSQPSPCCARETPHPASSLPGLRREVSWLVVAFPLLTRAKTHLWPFWPYSRQDACRTVQAVPDLVVFPSQLTCWLPARNWLLLPKSDSAITSTIYDSIASSVVCKACFVHSQRRSSRNSYLTLPELRSSWCSISRTVRTYASVDHGCFPLRAAINWSRSSLRTPPVRYIVSWPSSASIWIDSDRIACCFLFLLLPVSRTVWNKHRWSHLWWLRLQHRGGLTGVSVATFSHQVAHWLMRLSFGSIWIQSQLVEVFLEPWLAVVERWGRWCQKTCEVVKII